MTETLEETVVRLSIEVGATQIILAGLLSALGNSDRAALARLVASMPRPSPKGVTPLNPRSEAVAMAIDDLLIPVRKKLAGK